MNFAGTANVLGDVTNAVGAKIISGGGGATVFFDDVVNNGEIRTSANGFSVFFGSVSGSGPFTGTGTVNFEGDLTPGSSPGILTFGGDVVFGPGAALHAEIGGTAAGSEYDQLQIFVGEAALGGTLNLELINGYVPPPTQQFTLLAHATRAGTFDTLAGYSISGTQAFAVQYTNTITRAIAGQWNNPSLSGIIDVPGTKLDVTGKGSWNGTLQKRGAGAMEVQLSTSNVAAGAILDVQDGSVLLKSDVGATSANLSLQITGNGSATFESTVHLAALDVADTRTATLAAGGERVIVTESLNLNAAGTLDLTTNDLIVDYTGVSPAAEIEDWVRSAYNVTGDWQGDGITSSVAALDGNFVVAVADNALLAAPFGSAQGGPLFTGQDVDLTTVLVKFTHRADINLDGLVTPDDSAVFGGNYDEGQPATWATGDMNYDGVFTPDDAAIFGGAYDESLTSMPEPRAAVVLGIAIGRLLLRTRRKV
jgi:hypothetical protein